MEELITQAHARLICEACIRRVANFHGQIQNADTLDFLGVRTNNDIRQLKLLIRGLSDPTFGVTTMLHSISDAMFAGISSSSTVDDLTLRVFNGAIPDMTDTRATTVIRRSVRGTLLIPVPDPLPGQRLNQIGITPQNQDRFKAFIVNSQDFGVRAFKRLLDPSELVNVDDATPVSVLINILKTKTRPAFV